MTVRGAQTFEKRGDMENLKREFNQGKVNNIKHHGETRNKEFENKALDFAQRKKYEYLSANYVLGAFTCMKYFKKK